MLVYLEGGPLDGSVWDTGVLLGRVQIKDGAQFYEWTPDVKEGKTGKVAAIWRYNQSKAQGRSE